MAAIVLNGITKSYAPGNTAASAQPALRGVSTTIAGGEFVCLLGPSGCGKTTLLNILSGLDEDYEGRIDFRAQAGAMDVKPTISYMFQEPRLLPWLTVADNLGFVLDNARHDRQHIQQWLTLVGLADYADRYPMQLSLGMQQRVAVARALILEPQLLLLDEPFSSLDELTAMRMRRELLKLWQKQFCTVLFVTHNPLEAVYLADRVLIMSARPGHILAEVKVNTFLPRPRDPESHRVWELSRQLLHHFQTRSVDGY